jgi:uncharacterized surface protein with fasciclin (FAS1) repeats
MKLLPCRRGLALAGVIGARAVAVCESANLFDSIAALPNAHTFTSILKAAGLKALLSDPSNTFTVFVPTDDAFFATWPSYQLQYVLNTTASSLRFGQYAVHPGVLHTADIAAPANISTLAPNFALLATSADQSQASLADATCGEGRTTAANQPADNGVYHLVDTVFQPPAAVCPDKIFVAEQRAPARISSYGYECRSKRNETRHLYETDNQKPLGLATDDRAGLVFWTNDQDYPRRSPTSWISKIPYNESNFSVINDRLVDPQGLTLDSVREVLYVKCVDVISSG